jgi:penicillin-binding protein 2
MFKKILGSRLFALGIVMVLLFALLLQRVFSLQIVNGQDFVDEYSLTIKKERYTSGTRGVIYDKNGVVLAYNELSYSVAIEDSGMYASNFERNKKLNKELSDIIAIVEGNDDKIVNDFPVSRNKNGKYQFLISDSALERFRADIYGHRSVDDLEYNDELGYHEAKATPKQIVDFMCSEDKYSIHVQGKKEKEKDIDYYTAEEAYKIMVLRQAMSQNSYQKFIQTIIAKGVNEKTVAMIMEHSDTLTGVAITNDTTRKYNNSKYFSHIIGYTGKASQEEYENLAKKDDRYMLTDIVGKSGIEQEMEMQLQGTKGKETFYVDNVGRIVEVTEKKEEASGNDVYLSIDSDLQIAAYKLLEQEIAGILNSKIENIKEFDDENVLNSSDIIIPIYDVYYALIDNNVIDISNLERKNASSVETEINQSFTTKQSQILNELRQELNIETPQSYELLRPEIQDYMDYILGMLSTQGIFVNDKVDVDDEVYNAWKNKQTSLADYLRHGIAKDWIDITRFQIKTKYSDSSEIFEALVDYIIQELQADTAFSKKLYKYLLFDDMISGKQICMLLFEQNVLKRDETAISNLQNDTISAYSFIKEKIANLEITPDQLALAPCSGSTVILDVKTGETLACVSYPGYDNNRLANTVDTEYYNRLRDDKSLPMYNYATQQQTAPGSTFKPVTAAAGLMEGVITPDKKIKDLGVFDQVVDEPTCWIYPSNHGNINVREAIRDSCNYYFYTVGYDLGLNSTGVFDEAASKSGIEKLDKYAQLFGFGDKTGIEIPESAPKISDEYPITSAIGQGTHNYTTTEIARYTAALASRGNIYNLSLIKTVMDGDGKAVKGDYGASLKYKIKENEISQSSWDVIQDGMRMMVEANAQLKDIPANVGPAGKTGTVQHNKKQANHALFIGYAPFNNPEISISTRIAYGYTSANAVAVSKNILSYYFKLVNEKELIDGRAEDIDNNIGLTD